MFQQRDKEDQSGEIQGCEKIWKKEMRDDLSRIKFERLKEGFMGVIHREAQKSLIKLQSHA